MKLPAHKCELILTHNSHKSIYQNLSEYIADNELRSSFVLEGEYQKALEADSIWELQWYPNTPVGSYLVCASTLEACIESALKVEEGW